jgi:hypothetical protein
MEKIGCLMEVGGYLKTLLVILVSGKEGVGLLIGLASLYLAGRIGGERLYNVFLTSIFFGGGVVIVLLAMESAMILTITMTPSQAKISVAIAGFLLIGILMLLLTIGSQILGAYHAGRIPRKKTNH